ncbi:MULTISPECIES: hypothetical protein [unclassified Dehalobacter]|uniref:phage tail assembly chaperone n=1 Tax=unclassified Dehalobacter TaxID=2635733 RepID=UPI00104A9FE9|nr:MULTISPECIES: hypothetical protein [unclassified Dehalobacter]TCX51926.1 hypothetical protein C1I36_06305 [Dehalobacter sp. 14DCB1]TCX52986.1 hypothetical protein C1I38_07985 [Dehalobacter sp. 12DCB1]
MDMKYFMRAELKQDEIVEIPGIEIFKDEKGKLIPFKVKVLGTEEVNDIRKAFSKKRIVMDEKGKRLFDKLGRPVLSDETDTEAATRRLVVEALIYPDLKDPELMKFYEAKDVMEMPFKLFKNPKHWAYVSNAVAEVLGINSDEAVSDDELINEAKNS